jgi:hypothetical protein
VDVVGGDQRARDERRNERVEEIDREREVGPVTGVEPAGTEAVQGDVDRDDDSERERCEQERVPSVETPAVGEDVAKTAFLGEVDLG